MPTREDFCDEDVPTDVVLYLRDRGHQVALAREMGTGGESDALQLQMCANRKWVLITQNRRDFRRLHALWMTLGLWDVLTRDHGGILTIYEQEQRAPEIWAEALDEMLQQEEISLQGKMFLWRRSTRLWELESIAIR
ncbi:MAG: DUF5615 family PIN-like protein [Chloroflexi bacterium]|nr:DUF5615 family PIN-like protein [Chloroflexota bacterium]